MTTITFKENIKLTKTTFSSIDEFLNILLKNKNTSLEEEEFSSEEKRVLENRNVSIKNLENSIISSFE